MTIVPAPPIRLATRFAGFIASTVATVSLMVLFA